MNDYSPWVLVELEAESIESPAMMYSAGKNLSVLLRLAQKAFAPEKILFPLLHVDTSYKFAEMYAFRDRVCREAGVESRIRESAPA
jgi:sulfate adenylyltransferase subunit 2